MSLRIEVFYEGKSVFKGHWQDAPEPVRNYIASAEAHYGTELLREYLLTRSDPLSLLYRGYSYRVL